MTDLNDTPLGNGLKPSQLGWTLTSAEAIGDSGVIVGHGIYGGYTKAFIIYPQRCAD